MTADPPAEQSFVRFGGHYLGNGRARFRVWAPGRRRVQVVIDGTTHELATEPPGCFCAEIPAESGARYWYQLDGNGPYADPFSRSQPDGVQGSSQLLDTSHFPTSTSSWTAPRLDELVIYELHVGTFTSPGTFAAIIEHLQDLRAMGIRAIELMPIATFPGSHGWGYDGLYTSAPHHAYGTPGELAELVGAAHDADLGILLDVVYNHLGPGAEQITAFGPYLGGENTLWGNAIDYRQKAVREWAIQNAELWIGDYGFDGLRLDAAHAIHDDGDPHVLKELATRVKAIKPDTLVISETEPGDLRPIEQWGHDAQWADELHHALHVLLTGEHDGYYAPYGTIADVAKALTRPQRDRLVVCDQDHDQVGNRAFGDRLHGAKLRLAAFCVLLSPGTPLMFMGEEYDEQHPFMYFTDHIDPAIAEATRRGRRQEFAAFASFGGAEIPDPQAMSSFLESKLDPELGDPATLAYYHQLLELRSELRGQPVETTVDEEHRYLEVRRGDVRLGMNFSDSEYAGVPPWSGMVLS